MDGGTHHRGPVNGRGVEEQEVSQSCITMVKRRHISLRSKINHESQGCLQLMANASFNQFPDHLDIENDLERRTKSSTSSK